MLGCALHAQASFLAAIHHLGAPGHLSHSNFFASAVSYCLILLGCYPPINYSTVITLIFMSFCIPSAQLSYPIFSSLVFHILLLLFLSWYFTLWYPNKAACRAIRNTGSGAELCRSEPNTPLPTSRGPRASYLMSLSLNFWTCKMKIITVLLLCGHCED